MSENHISEMNSTYSLVETNYITMAFLSSRVAIIGTDFKLKKLPHAPSFFLGIEENLNIPVIDIFDLYNIKDFSKPESSLLVKLSLWLENESISTMEVGLFVDKFLGTVNIDLNTIFRFRPDYDYDQGGIIHLGTKKICLLNVDNLFSKNRIKEFYAFWLNKERLN